MSEPAWYETVPMPVLLRHARTTYGSAMWRSLAEAGYDDIPKNGLYVIGGLALGEGGVPLGQLIEDLRISKQAAGQLVDTLVTRGYLARVPDAQDRRKLRVSLTERGEAAAAAQLAARLEIDAELSAAVGADNILRTRRTLAALIGIGRRGAGTESGEEQ